MKIKIGIIGGGNMGGAIIGGLYKKFDVSVCEQDKKRCQQLKKEYKITSGSLSKVAARSKVIILAVKPQNFDEVLNELRPLVSKEKLIISIAAGISCAYIEKHLGGKIHVVRAMPNLPAQIGQGITGICPGTAAVKEDLICATRLFSRIGKAVVVEERWMDAVTAVSGSGPAYVFLFIECLKKAAVSLGLEAELSNLLIMETVRGSLRLLERQGEDPGVLRARVTSKGGTTQAAMEVFQKQKIEMIYQAALKAAAKRAKALSK